MRQIGVLEAKTHLSALLDEVERGGEVLITRHGRPVARLVAPVAIRTSGPEFADQVFQVRERIASEWKSEEPFDWKAAVEDGRA